jgi:hypothetical protein
MLLGRRQFRWDATVWRRSYFACGLRHPCSNYEALNPASRPSGLSRQEDECR